MNRLNWPGSGRRLGVIAAAMLLATGAWAQTQPHTPESGPNSQEQGANSQVQGPHFSHQTIFVTDLDRAANFYEKVMELKRIPEPFHDGRHAWFALGGHGQLHVVSGAKEDIPHDINIHLAFSVSSMTEFTKHLEAVNVKYGDWSQKNKTPQVRPDKVQQIYLQDPDGYWIEVNDDKF
jgi:lactoylglutathione lyase